MAITTRDFPTLLGTKPPKKGEPFNIVKPVLPPEVPVKQVPGKLPTT